MLGSVCNITLAYWGPHDSSSPHIYFFFLFAFPFSVLNAEETIKVAFGNALAPWVMPDKHEGIVVEIIEAALTPLDYKIEKVYLPYARRLKSYQLGLVDVVSDINTSTIQNEHLTGFFSDISYAYENFVYTLKKREFQFETLSDLVDYRLMSWQGAVAHLGDEYAEMAQNSPLYSEHHDQSVQVKMLYLERVDAIQMDKQIFNYYRKEVGREGEIDISPDVDEFAFLGESPNGYLFRSAKVRDEFNQQLKKIKASGIYRRIMNQHNFTPLSVPLVSND